MLHLKGSSRAAAYFDVELHVFNSEGNDCRPYNH